MTEELQKIIEAHEADIHRPPAHVVEQWHDALDNAAALERGRKAETGGRWHPGSFFWGVAVTAALAIGIGIGSLLPGDESESEAPVFANTEYEPAVTRAAFTRGLAVHLRDSRERLATVDEETDQTMLVFEIIQQNRVFVRVAERNDSPQLARVLRAFEPILVQLAANDIAPEDAEALRAQLAFELNVMLTKLAGQPSEESHTT